MPGGVNSHSVARRAPLRRNVPVVTVQAFYELHAEKLQLKLEGPRVGFHRKIREPTINRPGLALSGFYSYFAEKRVQVLGAAEQSYLNSLRSEERRVGKECRDGLSPYHEKK